MQPQIWQTIWFKAAGVATAIAAIYGFFRRRVAQVEERRHEQEAFSRQLIESQEDERKRIAGELHDSLAQELQLIRNRAQMALNLMEPPPPVAEQLAEISAASSRAIAETRAISYALRPPELEHFGISRAIEVMIEKVAEAFGLQASAEVEKIDGLLQPEMEINLYRILQESLNNVVKHAAARKVIVSIKRMGSQIEASVFDDGRGFMIAAEADSKARPPSSLGVSGMKERAAILKGTLEIQSALGKGTRVSILLPINP
jgi:signal transduction histidine kinase